MQFPFLRKEKEIICKKNEGEAVLRKRKQFRGVHQAFPLSHTGRDIALFNTIPIPKRGIPHGAKDTSFITIEKKSLKVKMDVKFPPINNKCCVKV